MVLLAGCGDDEPCVPGEQVECACSSGDEGAQRCNDQGSAYEECQCDAENEDASGSDKMTEEDASTSSDDAAGSSSEPDDDGLKLFVAWCERSAEAEAHIRANPEEYDCSPEKKERDCKSSIAEASALYEHFAKIPCAVEYVECALSYPAEEWVCNDEGTIQQDAPGVPPLPPLDSDCGRSLFQACPEATLCEGDADCSWLGAEFECHADYEQCELDADTAKYECSDDVDKYCYYCPEEAPDGRCALPK